MIPLARTALPVLVIVALAARAGGDHCEGYDTIRPDTLAERIDR